MDYISWFENWLVCVDDMKPKTFVPIDKIEYLKALMSHQALEMRVYQKLSSIYHMPLYQASTDIDLSYMQHIPETLYNEKVMIVIEMTQDVLHLGTYHPSYLEHMKKITTHRKETMTFSLITMSDFETFKKRFKRYKSLEILRQTFNVKPTSKPLKKTQLVSDEAPMITYAKTMIDIAMQEKASDIHMIYDGNIGYVKCRIDGQLETIQTHDLSRHEALIRRFLVLASLDTIHKDLPQDGMFEMQIGEHTYTFRIALLKAYYTWHAVIRIIHNYHQFETLDQLGLDHIQRDIIIQHMIKKSGFIVVTGTTGSGKSTTIHALLRHKHHEGDHTITIEHPVEHIHPGMTQIDMKDTYGVAFEDVLKHCLRMDPDTLFIGEIRDEKTAKLAVHAAMTGHYVTATMHTSQAHLVYERFIHLGIDPLHIKHMDLLVMHQILIPLTCTYCHGMKCPRCMMRGFSNRKALFEIQRYQQQEKKMIIYGPSISKQLKDLYVQKHISHDVFLQFMVEE
jgi:type IV pilus assembly protein PilB